MVIRSDRPSTAVENALVIHTLQMSQGRSSNIADGQTIIDIFSRVFHRESCQGILYGKSMRCSGVKAGLRSPLRFLGALLDINVPKAVENLQMTNDRVPYREGSALS